jgi:hypothetical protein
MFRLYLDLDRNIRTGEDWSQLGKKIGSDLNVDLMVWSEKWVVMPEENAKQVSFHVESNTVVLTITDKRFKNISGFDMFAWVNGPKGNMDVVPNEGYCQVSLSK